MSIKYEHLLAVDDKKGIRENVVYIKIDYDFIGAYFGYEGVVLLAMVSSG